MQFFGDPSMNALTRPLELKLFLKTGSPVVFNFQICPHWAFFNSSSAFQVSYPVTGSHRSFCSRISAQASCNSLYLPVCLPIIGSSGLFCALPLLWIRESCLVFSPFSLLVAVDFWPCCVACGTFPTGDWTAASCSRSMESWSWTAGEVPLSFLLVSP